jgi:serine protease inhibitor
MVTDKKRPVRLEYENRVEKDYEAEVLPVNFVDVAGTLSAVNNYVSKQTNGLIKDTVSQDDLFKVN